MEHLARVLILALPLALCSCLATSGEIDRAIADITGRINVVARDSQESADAARAAWQRGEIDYAELEKRLQDIRAATMGTGKEIVADVLEGVKETMAQRPEAAVRETTETIGGMLPGTAGEILIFGGGLIATYLAARREAAAKAAAAKREAEDALYDFKLERTQEHLAKAEAKK
jgi:hypothetical protein